MDELNSFISEKQCEFSSYLPNISLISEMENLIGVKVGPQLKEYLLNYGYLAKNDIEFNGLVANLGMDSDICRSTISLHNHFKETNNMIKLENAGDGDYYLVDCEDNIYRFCPSARIFEKTNMKLFEYILNRLK